MQEQTLRVTQRHTRPRQTHSETDTHIRGRDIMGDSRTETLWRHTEAHTKRDTQTLRHTNFAAGFIYMYYSSSIVKLIFTFLVPPFVPVVYKFHHSTYYQGRDKITKSPCIHEKIFKP